MAMSKPKNMQINFTLTVPSDTPFMHVAKGVSLLANHLQPGCRVNHNGCSFKIDVEPIQMQEQAA
jgi:hypothetical protein